MNKLLIKEICCMDPVQRTTWKIQSKALQRGRGGEGGRGSIFDSFSQASISSIEELHREVGPKG